MKSDDGNPRPWLESPGQNAQALFERAKLVVHFHAQSLKNLRGRVTPTVTADKFFDLARQWKSLTERGCFAHLYDQARDPARSGFLSQLEEISGQLFCAVLVSDGSSSQLIASILAHDELNVA